MYSKKQAVILVGCPSAGKTSYALSEIFSEFKYVPPKLEQAHDAISYSSLKAAIHDLMDIGSSIIIDGCNPTRKIRSLYVDILKSHPSGNDYAIECHFLDTPIIDCRKNADIRLESGGERINIVNIIKFKKFFEMPLVSEGFSSVSVIPFLRKGLDSHSSSALFFSLSSISHSSGKSSLPTCPEEVRLNDDVNEKLMFFFDKGFKLIGVDNIPCISGASEVLVQDCIMEVIKLITPPIESIYYEMDSNANEIPSKMFRLPNPYFAKLAEKQFNIVARKSIMVGSGKVHKQFSESANFVKYFDRRDFFSMTMDEITDVLYSIVK